MRIGIQPHSPRGRDLGRLVVDEDRFGAGDVEVAHGDDEQVRLDDPDVARGDDGVDESVEPERRGSRLPPRRKRS